MTETTPPLIDPLSIRVRDRKSGAVEVEKIYGAAGLGFVYTNPLGRLLHALVLGRPWASRLWGRMQRSSRSRRKIPHFLSSLGIDGSEAEKPVAEYGSLDDFFTRRLRPGARPVDQNPNHLISPGDGRMSVVPHLRGELVVKKSRVGLAEFLGDATLASRYEGGMAFVLRLAPPDYHRFHFPDDGIASAPRRVEGGYHSVHMVALNAGAPSFRNKREITILESRRFGSLTLVEVGALFVGTIVQTFRPGPVRRGDEKGYFRFGGSTTVVLAERGRVRPDPDLLRWSALHPSDPGTSEPIESLVQMGEHVGSRP